MYKSVVCEGKGLLRKKTVRSYLSYLKDERICWGAKGMRLCGVIWPLSRGRLFCQIKAKRSRGVKGDEERKGCFCF